jgi:nucleoid-associated protein YgaU
MANSITTMTVAGGNLMAIAAQVYGDATQWNRMAALKLPEVSNL